ncbi:biotin--[acetyl-CoA-carboxylase] ligase [Thermaurantiacus sp.]
MSAIVLDEVGSTNDWLFDHAEGLPDGQWVRARRQTAGRGRQGRAWHTADGNLAASVLVRLPVPHPPGELGFVAGVALHETACELSGDRSLALKWPNDLLRGEAKLAGILLERRGDLLVIGVGANLAHAPVVPGRATAAFAPALDPGSFLELLAARLALWRRRWAAEGFPPIRAAWLARAHPPGTALRVAGPPAADGRFLGLAEDGALRLETPSGELRIHAGDVMLAPQAGTAA